MSSCVVTLLPFLTVRWQSRTNLGTWVIPLQKRLLWKHIYYPYSPSICPQNSCPYCLILYIILFFLYTRDTSMQTMLCSSSKMVAHLILPGPNIGYYWRLWLHDLCTSVGKGRKPWSTFLRRWDFPKRTSKPDLRIVRLLALSITDFLKLLESRDLFFIARHLELQAPPLPEALFNATPSQFDLLPFRWNSNITASSSKN